MNSKNLIALVLAGNFSNEAQVANQVYQAQKATNPQGHPSITPVYAGKNTAGAPVIVLLSDPNHPDLVKTIGQAYANAIKTGELLPVATKMEVTKQGTVEIQLSGATDDELPQNSKKFDGMKLFTAARKGMVHAMNRWSIQSFELADHGIAQGALMTKSTNAQQFGAFATTGQNRTGSNQGQHQHAH